jgi:hypothetical protein
MSKGNTPLLIMGPIDGMEWPQWIRTQHKQSPYYPTESPEYVTWPKGDKNKVLITDPISGDLGVVRKLFGPSGTRTMVFPKSGEREYFRFEVEVESVNRNSIHSEGDIYIWCVPIHLVRQIFLGYWAKEMAERHGIWDQSHARARARDTKHHVRAR